MGNKTIYVKNDELWETAKSMAGKDGLSSFIEEAVQRLVTAKQLEQKVRQPFSLPYKPMDKSFTVKRAEERLGFEGKCLLDWGPFAVYLTKGGTFIVTDNSGDEDQSILDYQTYDELDELQKARSIAALDKEQQDRVWNRIRDALPPQLIHTIWID